MLGSVQNDMPPILVEQLPVLRRSLRIAVVTETYPPEINGVATSAAQFVEGLRRLGHQIHLVRPRQGRGDAPGSDAGLSQALTRGLAIPRYPDLKMGLPAKRVLKRLWSLHRPDVVHVVTEGPLGWSALQTAKLMGIPVVSDFRTNFHAYSRHYGIGWLKKPILGYLRKFHNRTLFTLVPTEAMRSTLVEAGFRNVEVIARGVDTRLFDPARRSQGLRTAWGAEPDTPVILHVGRLAPEKNLTALAAAFEAIRRSAPGARFVVVGDGPARAWLEERCPGIVFAGTRTGTDLAEHYASADIFLFPSLTETYGNVTVEAMASGLAVVAFDYGAAGLHIHDGWNGLLAGGEDSPAWVRLAAGLAEDPRHARVLGARAREAALELGWDRVVKRLEAVLLSASGMAPEPVPAMLPVGHSNSVTFGS
jgi:glycosyltransferase involved in cell wall biosynthesis